MDFKIELLKQILELHISVYNHSIRNSKSKTKIPIFSYIAPGHFSSYDIEIPNLLILYKELPQEIKNQFIEIYEKSNLKNKCVFEGTIDNRGFVDSFIEGFSKTYLTSVISDSLERYNAFLFEANKHSIAIVNWIINSTNTRYIEIVIQPNINFGVYTHLNNWEEKKMNMIEKSVEGHSGFESTQEASLRLNFSSFLRRNLNSIQHSRAEILLELDILTLSLWLSLGQIYKVEDMRFIREPWFSSPDDKSPFGIKFTHIWENILPKIGYQTFIRPNHKRSFSFADSLTNEFHQKILLWMKILEENKESIFGLNMISDGFSNVAKSMSEQPFKKDKTAMSGIFKIISGLEGLNSKCKKTSKNGNKIESTKTFKECWSIIWINALSRDPKNEFLSKTSDIMLALNNIYSLRSDIAHSDPSQILKTLDNVKKSIGIDIENEELSFSSVGFTLIMIVDELLEELYQEPNNLKQLNLGLRPILI